MRAFTGVVYRWIVKPILFRFPADSVHELFISLGEYAGWHPWLHTLTHAFWGYDDGRLVQTIHGMSFKNPIGLSAGFDYDARLIGILPSVGFGFHTVGTVTNGAYAGNPRPMLGRLPKSRSLLVNKGFKSAGIDAVGARIERQKSSVPLGMSIGATNRSYGQFSEMVEEIARGFIKAEAISRLDYYELNISCPNLINIRNIQERFDTPAGLAGILERLSSLSLVRPVFIKMPLEKSIEETRALLDAAAPFPFIKGLIFSNLAKDRTNPRFDRDEIKAAGKGNFSGKPTEAKSNELIGFTYARYKDRFTIIGCGGVFTAEDAYKKIRLGASLVQMITGMIYMGPQQIGAINKGLVKLLERDGCKTIAEAVGRAAPRFAAEES